VKHDPESDPRPEPAAVLQSRFREGELDRTISAHRFRLAVVRWLYLPVLAVALVLMILGLILGWGSFGPVFGGAVAILGGVLSLVHMTGGMQDNLREMEEERDSAVASLESGSQSGSGAIRG